MGIGERAGNRAEESVGPGEGAIRAQPVDPKRREAQQVELGETGPSIVGVLAALGIERGVAVAGEFLNDIGVIRQIDVRCQNIDGRTAGAPDVVHERLRAAAGIVARPQIVGLDDPGVHVHGERIFFFALRGDVTDVRGVVPRHEDFVGVIEQIGVGGPGLTTGAVGHGLVVRRTRDILAEDFFPRARGLVAGGVPNFLHFRQQVFPVLLEIGGQLLRNGAGEGGVGRGAKIARAAHDAHFVLHLPSDDRLILIDLAEVFHDGGESLGVAIAIGRAKRREDFQRLALAIHHARESVLIGLDPRRREVRQAVFPAGHPEEDEPHVGGAGGLDLVVDHREIELAFFRLDQVPGNDGQDGVEIRRRQPCDGRLGAFPVRGGGIGQLTCDADERPAIDNEFGHPIAFFQMGDVGYGGLGAGRSQYEDTSEYAARKSR